MKAAIGAILAVSLVFISSALAEPHKSGVISDVDTVQIYRGLVEENGISTQITLSYEERYRDTISRSFSRDYILSEIAYSLDLLSEFNETLNIPMRECRSNYSLNIFAISNRTMWDETRVKRYSREMMISPGNIVYAFYDPTSGVYGENNIVITNMSEIENHLSIQHELSHYWWDRMCFATYFDGSSEDYARRYERYVRRVNAASN